MSENENSLRARARWKMLYKTLKGYKKTDKEDIEYSTRSFSGYNLFEVSKIEDRHFTGHSWFEYTLRYLKDVKPLKFKILETKLSASELAGFDNTGNVCVWPSEEVLGYYCLKNKEKLKNKKICELGCGMTGLAGIQIAGNSDCNAMLLTDGNENSVQNLGHIVKENEDIFEETQVLIDVLRWGEDINNFSEKHGSFDVIICADCLFFVNVQDKLLKTIYQLMRKDGFCSIFAPKRGDTLERFVKLAQDIFVVEIETNYDHLIWDLHLFSTSNKYYCVDLHFPLMITLTHRP